MSQQWYAAGTGALAAAVLGGDMCGVNPFGGRRHQPHHRTARWTITKVKVKVKLLSHVQLSATLWTEAQQASPPMGFSRQEH